MRRDTETMVFGDLRFGRASKGSLSERSHGIGIVEQAVVGRGVRLSPHGCHSTGSCPGIEVMVAIFTGLRKVGATSVRKDMGRPAVAAMLARAIRPRGGG
jgi:hypothetical protein